MTVSVPVRAVVEVEVNRTVTEQVPFGAKDVLQVVDTNEKSVPDTDAVVGTVTARLPMPVLVSVAVAVLDDPTGVAGNVGVDSVAAWAWPVPVRFSVAGPVPLCAIVTVPGREPVLDGLNVTSILQVPFTATEVQVWDRE